RKPNKININMAPIIKTAISHRLSFLNTSFISFIYCLKGTGVSLESFFFLIKNITIKTEIRQNKGIEKKGKNQITAVKAAPKIGLNTLPAVFAVSIIPSVALATDSL